MHNLDLGSALEEGNLSVIKKCLKAGEVPTGSDLISAIDSVGLNDDDIADGIRYVCEHAPEATRAALAADLLSSGTLEKLENDPEFLIGWVDYFANVLFGVDSMRRGMLDVLEACAGVGKLVTFETTQTLHRLKIPIRSDAGYKALASEEVRQLCDMQHISSRDELKMHLFDISDADFSIPTDSATDCGGEVSSKPWPGVGKPKKPTKAR